MQQIHDKRNKEYRIHFKKIAKYEQKNKDLLTRTPIHIELEEKFKKTVELPEIENREKVLQSIKEFKKPLDHESIKRHS